MSERLFGGVPKCFVDCIALTVDLGQLRHDGRAQVTDPGKADENQKSCTSGLTESNTYPPTHDCQTVYILIFCFSDLTAVIDSRRSAGSRPLVQLPLVFEDQVYLAHKSLPSVCSAFFLFCCISLFFCTSVHARDIQAPWNAPHFSIAATDLYRTASEPVESGESGVAVFDDEERYAYDDEHRSLYTEYIVYKVLSQKGADEWNEINVHWEPWHQQRPTVRVRVITPDLVVHDLDPRTLTDAPTQDEQSDIYSDRRVIRAPLPAIGPGAVVEQEIVIPESTPYFKAGILGRYFVGRLSVPTHHSRLILEAPSYASIRYSMNLVDLRPVRTEQGNRVTLIFERNDIAPLEPADPYLPSELPAYPFIAFSTGASWPAVAKDYGEIIDGKIDTSDVKSLVDKLIRGKPAQIEKIEAISAYLNREIRYTGIEFGESAIVPHSPSETLIHKYGDCKDKSTLLIAMLRAAGVPAYIALLNVGERMEVPSDLPGLGLFDHAIVYIPGSPDIWVDATDEFARVGQLPTLDQGRLAFVVRPETSSLVRIPEASSQQNLLSETREITLAEYGPARIMERSQPHGSDESSYRRAYADLHNKTTRQNLASYFRSQYSAENLDKLDRSSPDDLRHQFELVLEGEKAKRGFTDLNIAVAAIPLDGLFGRLPSELRSAKSGSEIDSQNHPKRTADFQLPQAFATEWHYTIDPPAGFRPKPLPKDVDLSLGPCVFREAFSTNPDNSVRVDLIFDTLRRRLRVEEARELRAQVTHLLGTKPILIYFEPVGEALLGAGQVRDALQAYRDSIRSRPNEPVPHLRLASAQLAAGLGEAAREEARAATKLAPESALAQKTLAEILEYDIFGRKFRNGSDYAGAETAFQTAEKLDPADKTTVANHAILLEHDHWGLRYGYGARLDDAIEKYKQLSFDEMGDLGIQNNLSFALFYAGQFSESEKTARASNTQPTALIVACEAALNGREAGMIEARKMTEGNEQFRQVIRTAGGMLENIRKYSLAADFVEAGAAETDGSDQHAYASLLRRAVPHEHINPPDDPAGAAIRLLLLEQDTNATVDEFRAISSRNGKEAFATPEILDRIIKTQRTNIIEKSRKGILWKIGDDFSIARAQPSVQGSDVTGYRVVLWPTTDYRRSVYVVRDNNHYKILATSRYPDAIGLEVLDRLDANDQIGAQTLLDWLREDQHTTSNNNDDPLAGSFLLPRFWTKGKKSDVAKMRLAAAAILVMSHQTAARGVPIFEAAAGSVLDDPYKANIEIALVNGYENLREYHKGAGVALRLLQEHKESDTALRWQGVFSRATGQSAETDAIALERLRSAPNDLEAQHQMEYDAVAREEFAKVHEIAQAILKSGQGGTSELNVIAWFSLFSTKPMDSDLEAALKGVEEGDHAWGILHTLGCVYAEIGKLKEAREVLQESMDAANLDEPDANFWYAFGRIAEKAGDLNLARTDYLRAMRPKNPFEIPGSSYELAQIRLEGIRLLTKSK